MPERIPQSVGLRVPLKAYLSSDHVTPATGKTIAVTLSKNGAAYGNPSAGATNAVEIANGSYYVDLSTTDTGTVGPLFVLGTSGGVDPVEALYDVAAPPTVNLNLSQVGLAPRALDAVADAALTVGDALVCAIASAAGKESISGTAYLVETPFTATVIRTFTLNSSSAPTART